MTIASNPPSVTAAVTFTEPPADGERAFLMTKINPVTGERDTNYERPTKQVVIENLRGKEGSATLDTSGFQLYSSRPPTHASFSNDEEIKREYYPESIELIKELTGASRVVLFDHTIRRRRPGETGESPQKRQPATIAHIDQTPNAALVHLHRHLSTSDTPELLKHRWQIINLWRPISHAAIDWPLALCDFRSVDKEKDIIPVSLLYPDREARGETYGVRYNPEHRWKYVYEMRPDELLLIKCFDSIQDGSVASFTPHTAFADPTTPPGTPFRESIELRALVFYDD